MNAAHPPLKWGQVKMWASDNKVPDDAVIAFDRGDWSAIRVRDLDFHAADSEGPAEFVLRERWG